MRLFLFPIFFLILNGSVFSQEAGSVLSYSDLLSGIWNQSTNTLPEGPFPLEYSWGTGSTRGMGSLQIDLGSKFGPQLTTFVTNDRA